MDILGSRVLYSRLTRFLSSRPDSKLADSPWETVLDPSVLDEVLSLEQVQGSSLLVELFEMYLESSNQALEALRDACSRGDASSMIAKAHELKSASASLGATGASACFVRVESCASAGNFVEMPQVLEALEVELGRTWTAMKELIAQSP